MIFSSRAAFAVTGFPFDPSQFSNIESLVSPAVVNSFVETIGIVTADRPYEPASGLGTNVGIDLSVDVTLFKVPDPFIAALSQAGVASGATLPVIPIPRLHFIKGFGPRLDIGGSIIWYDNMFAWSVDMKGVIFIPEEGPTWAIRLGFAHSFIGFVTTSTWTPAVIASQPLDFMEPYIGADIQFIYGSVGFTAPPPYDQVIGTVSINGSGVAGDLFGGVAFKIPGFKITMEGAYNTYGADALGVKVGFNF